MRKLPQSKIESSVRPKRVNTEYTEYRSFGILTEPNNTEPNLLVEENKDYPLFDNFFTILLWFYVTIFSNFFKFRQKKSTFKKHFYKNCFMSSFLKKMPKICTKSLENTP